MEENICFQSEFTYDLPAYREFTKLNLEAHVRNTVMYISVSVCLIYLICMLDYVTSPLILLVLSLVWLGVHLLQWHRGRKGGLDYKRLLRSNNGVLLRQMILVEESGIKARNPDTEREYTDTFDAVRYMMESKQLLVLVNDLKMCYVFDKANLQGGSRDELVAFLREKCPKLRKRIRNGTLGRISKILCVAVTILALVFSLAHLLHIPEKLSGQLTNDMTYQEMAEELAPLGISISDQTIRELEAYDAEYAAEHGDYYRENPYASKVLDMLYWEGAGIYDEATDIWTPSPSGVYWFDLEVYDVSCMYTDFLNGLNAMDESLEFSNLSQDFSSVDWESGTGIAKVSFDFDSQHYEINLTFDQDWFDPLMLTHVARILDRDPSPEKLWYSLDGQAVFLYYGTADQAESLEKKTGAIWLDPVNQPLYS